MKHEADMEQGEREGGGGSSAGEGVGECER